MERWMDGRERDVFYITRAFLEDSFWRGKRRSEKGERESGVVFTSFLVQFQLKLDVEAGWRRRGANNAQFGLVRHWKRVGALFLGEGVLEPRPPSLAAKRILTRYHSSRVFSAAAAAR